MTESQLAQDLIQTSNLIFQLQLYIKQANNDKCDQLFPALIDNLKKLQQTESDLEISWQELGCIESGVNLDLMLRDQLQILVQKYQKLRGKKQLYDLYLKELIKDD